MSIGLGKVRRDANMEFKNFRNLAGCQDKICNPFLFAGVQRLAQDGNSKLNVFACRFDLP
jgi:hypothetical protein